MLETVAAWNERFEAWWSSRGMRKARSLSLAVVLLGGIGLIEMHRRGLLPGVSGDFPKVHLAAIAWTVSLLLLYEIVEILLSLSRSVANSVGKHLQLYALVLLRDAFAELSHFEEPISISSDQFHQLGAMGSDAAGAIALFALSVAFGALQRHRPIVSDDALTKQFVQVKNLISLALIGVLVFLLLRDVGSMFWGDKPHRLINVFFTVLVFVDVLLAVISIGYTDKAALIFRNFGFAFAAILLRIAIASPEFIRPTIGVAGGLVAIAVTLSYNWAIAESPNGDQFEQSDEVPSPS